MDKGVFDRFRSLPIARIAPLSGALLADTVRYAIATTLTFAMGFILGFRPEGGLGSVIVAGLLVIACSWAVSWIFAFFRGIARNDRRRVVWGKGGSSGLDSGGSRHLNTKKIPKK